MTNYVEDYFNERQQSFSDSSDDDEGSVDFDIDYSDDDWQWEERLRLINEFSNWTSGNDNLDQFIQQTQLETPKSEMNQIEVFDKILASKIIKSNNNNNNNGPTPEIDPFAIYTSRFLLYPNLPEPRNRPEVMTKYHDDEYIPPPIPSMQRRKSVLSLPMDHAQLLARACC
ncbi:11452_t:CDS:2 [Diversispora eburnea]|uniref:11452_t:CDS:1 n=1 Tax=Diversispora eburnea TaxID=1213867 RepID=A0A9N9G0W6_9GLOM|nr:11452_t:CDS:2 [Diversispora eburnea]